MKVHEVMSRVAATCRMDDSLNRAAQLMWERDCGFLPVVDEGRVVGVVTDRDACMAAYTKGLLLAAIRVADVMSRQVKSCRPDESLDEARERMAHHQVRRLPVVEDGHLVGVLSLNDIALAAQARWRGKPSGAQVAETLAAVCRHGHEFHAAAAE